MHDTACLNLHTAPQNTAARWSEIAERCGTDQGPYMPQFWAHLNGLRNAAFTLLEIGVYNGGSLKTWKEIFPNAKIYALDIDPRCAQYEDPPRVKITIGSQADPVALEDWVERGRAPSGLTAMDANPGANRTRPLCEWPKWPKFTGVPGTENSAASYTCVNE